MIASTSTSSFHSMEESSPRTSTTASGISKPAIPQRSHRRKSLVGEIRPHFVMQDAAPPVPGSPTIAESSVTAMTSSCSMQVLSYSAKEYTASCQVSKRASTGATAFPSSMTPVAPLKISNKKVVRPTSSPVLKQSSKHSPTSSTAVTPTMPMKSRSRKSIDSPSGNLTLSSSSKSASSSTSQEQFSLSSQSSFVNGIGLDFGTSPIDAAAIDIARAASMTSSKSGNVATTTTASLTSDDDGASRSDSPPSSIATSNADRRLDDFVLIGHAKSHDAVFSHNTHLHNDDDDEIRADSFRLKRASLLSAVPMTISKSHQEMIEESPNRFRRNEAMGVFDSVLGLMADLHDDMEDRGVEGKGEVEWGERTVDGKKEARGDRGVVESASGDLGTWMAAPLGGGKMELSTGQETPLASSMEREGRSSSMPSIQVAGANQKPSNTPREAMHSTNTTPQKARQNLEVPQPSQPGNASENEAGTSPRMRGLWGLLGASSPSKAAHSMSRTASASSYSSNSSFIQRATSPSAASAINNGSATSLLSNSNFSLFGRKLLSRSVSDTHASSTPTAESEEVPLRLSRRDVDEDKLADLIISCADARHVLKTDTSPTKLKEVGLKLELGWREQLAEAQKLRTRLEVTQDTVEDLEDENKHLRSQLGSLSEQIVSREEAMEELKGTMEGKVRKERERGEAEMEGLKAEKEVVRREGERKWTEEKAVALGLGMMLKTQQVRRRGAGMFDVHDELVGVDPDSTSGWLSSTNHPLPGLTVPGSASRPASILFDLASDPEENHTAIIAKPQTDLPSSLRRSALMQARPHNTDFPVTAQTEDSLDLAYQDLFRCPAHRFAQGSAAPPSTLVDERVVLVGTDQNLLRYLAETLRGLGLTRILLATPSWSSASPSLGSPSSRVKGVKSMTFDCGANDAWREVVVAARAELGGDVDCVVNAFDGVDMERLGDVVGLLKQQATVADSRMDENVGATTVVTQQPVSVVNIVYDHDEHGDVVEDDATKSMCTMALIGLANTLSVRNSCSVGRSSSRAVRFNTVVSAKATPVPLVAESILRLMDPCSTVQGSIIQPGSRMHCLGPPLCPALPALFTSPSLTSPNLSQSQTSSSMLQRGRRSDAWLKVHKRIADVELIDALESENEALRRRVEALERSCALLKGE